MHKKNKKSLLHIILPVSAIVAVFFFVVLFIFTCLNSRVAPQTISLPYNLIAVLKDKAINLEWHWDGNPRKVTGFIVERKEEGTSEYSKAGETSNLFFRDATPENIKQRYVYRIFAYKDTLRSEYSNEAVVEVKLPEAANVQPVATPARERPVIKQPDDKSGDSITPSPLPKQIPSPDPKPGIPTPSPMPILEETPEPGPFPETDVGKVWLVPNDFSANVSARFRFELHVNTGDRRLSAYAMEIAFPDEIVSLDTSIGTGGVIAGPNGFLSSVTVKESGKILLSGLAGEPREPSEDLNLLSFALIAKSPGISSIDIKVTNLKDNNKATIGYPRGISGSVSITLARVLPNERLYVLGQPELGTPVSGDRRMSTPSPMPDAESDSSTRDVPDPTPDPETATDDTGEEPEAEPSPEWPLDYATPNPESRTTPYPQSTPYYEPAVTPFYEPAATPYWESITEPTIEPYVEQTVEPYVEPTIEPTPEPTPFYVFEVPTPEITIEPTPEPTPEPFIMPTPEITIVPTPVSIIEPTPDPTPEPVIVGMGNVWFVPQTTSAYSGSPFVVSIHINTGNKVVSSYGFTISYDASIIGVDKSKGNKVVEAESYGYISAINVNKDGEIKVGGFDAMGKGPGVDLPFLKINFIAKATGTTQLGIKVDNLTDAEPENLGNPTGIPGEVVVQ